MLGFSEALGNDALNQVSPCLVGIVAERESARTLPTLLAVRQSVAKRTSSYALSTECLCRPEFPWLTPGVMFCGEGTLGSGQVTSAESGPSSKRACRAPRSPPGLEVAGRRLRV